MQKSSSWTQGVFLSTFHETPRGKASPGRSFCGRPTRASYSLAWYLPFFLEHNCWVILSCGHQGQV